MPRTTKGAKGAYVELPEDVLEAMKALAVKNGRSWKDELTSACRRHLKTPPVIVEGPELEEERVPAGLKPRKGRPKGEKKG